LLLDKLGYDELFIGEHYSAATEPYPSPLMLAASLVPRTERLIFGTGVINAPLPPSRDDRGRGPRSSTT